MGKAEREKGARVERYIVKLHEGAGIACEKVSRSGCPGEDLWIDGQFTGEVKGRREAPKTLVNWLGNNDLLFIKPDRQQPLVVMPWSMHTAPMQHLPQR